MFPYYVDISVMRKHISEVTIMFNLCCFQHVDSKLRLDKNPKTTHSTYAHLSFVLTHSTVWSSAEHIVGPIVKVVEVSAQSPYTLVASSNAFLMLHHSISSTYVAVVILRTQTLSQSIISLKIISSKFRWQHILTSRIGLICFHDETCLCNACVWLSEIKTTTTKLSDSESNKTDHVLSDRLC